MAYDLFNYFLLKPVLHRFVLHKEIVQLVLVGLAYYCSIHLVQGKAASLPRELNGEWLSHHTAADGTSSCGPGDVLVITVIMTSRILYTSSYFTMR